MFDIATAAYSFVGQRSATAFLFKLIAQLQLLGTVPMIDLDPYARWLKPVTNKKATTAKKTKTVAAKRSARKKA